jgi:cysteine-rich repeat protein
MRRRRRRPPAPLWLLVLLLLLHAPPLVRGGQSEALLCNGESALAKDFAREVYRRYPVQRADECDNPGPYEEQYKAGIGGCAAALAVACLTGVGCPIGIVAEVLCMGEVNRVRDTRLARCSQLARRLKDQAANLNARIPLTEVPFLATPSTTVFADYVLPLDASVEGVVLHSLDGRHTTWRAVAFAAASLTSAGASCTQSASLAALAPCASSWLLLPDASLGGKTLTVDKGTFLRAQQSLAPDLVFDSERLLQTPANPKGVLIRTAKAGTRTAGWGFVLDGCALPVVTLRTEWTLITQRVQGESVADTDSVLTDINERGAPPKVRCWARMGRVVEVGSAPMQCQMGFTLNDLRVWLAKAETMTPNNLAEQREIVLKQMQLLPWARSADGRRDVLVPRAYAEGMLTCAQPMSTAGNLVGGTWVGWTTGVGVHLAGTPGLCVACGGLDGPELRRNNQQVRACNRSQASERIRDCCTGCLPGHLQVSASTCVARCKAGYAYSSAAGQCLPCPTGTFSRGGLGACLTCTALGVPNAYVDARHAGVGCVACGLRAERRVTAAGGGCMACAPGKLVPPGADACQGCAAGHYVPMGAQVTACAACAPGTFYSSSTTTTKTASCQLCAVNTYSQRAASTVCTACAVGTRHTPNRTACAPCPALNGTRLPFVEYFEGGCALRCRPGVGYLRTNPYSAGGCGDCATVKAPVGRFVSASGQCTQTQPCTNKPASNAVYVNGSTVRNVSACGWACNAGFYPSSAGGGGTCVPCATSGFNAAVHRRTASGCAFTCKEFQYVDLPALTCAQTCNDLLVDFNGGVLLSTRVRHYYNAAAGGHPRPRYVQGVCGSAATVPNGRMPVLRRGRWAYRVPDAAPLPLGFVTLCGNAVLDWGEACDDGNTAGGDGCSASCAIEVNRYWDCDVIGAACLPNCGWSTDSDGGGGGGGWGVSLLQQGGGYVLPACRLGVCACTNLTYYDVVGLNLMGDRSLWMAQHLVPCDCGGNAQRMLPYAECNALNRGCRQCGAQEYHDDVRGRCVGCGTQCAPGFVSELTKRGFFSVCTGTLSSSYTLRRNATQAQAQLDMGCAPCPRPDGEVAASDVRYVRECAYTCHRDSTGGLNRPEQDTFCSTPVMMGGVSGGWNAAGVCNLGEGGGGGGGMGRGVCRFCRPVLQAVIVAIRASPSTSVFYYPQGCRDVDGYGQVPCDAAALPANARWTASTEVVGASGGCAWACVATAYAWNGGCLPCFAYSLASGVAPGCVPGQWTGKCLSAPGYIACVPCVGPLPGGLMAWTSSGYFTACMADCELGVGFGALSADGSVGTCTACSRVVCALGELYVPCTRRTDATCLRCNETAAGALAENSEYATAGSCISRCAAGYFWEAVSPGQCVPCRPVGGEPCTTGQYPSSMCQAPEERLDPPVCLPCPNTPVGEGMMWVLGSMTCAQQCLLGRIPRASLPGFNTTAAAAAGIHGGGCVPCGEELCALGSAGVCLLVLSPRSVVLECTPCDAELPRTGMQWVRGGNCEAVACLLGWVPHSLRDKGCVDPRATPEPTNSLGQQQAASPLLLGGVVHPELTYPTRTRQHSGMQSPPPTMT